MVKLADFGPLGQLGANLRAAADCLYSAPEVLRKVCAVRPPFPSQHTYT